MKLISLAILALTSLALAATSLLIGAHLIAQAWGPTRFAGMPPVNSLTDLAVNIASLAAAAFTLNFVNGWTAGLLSPDAK